MATKGGNIDIHKGIGPVTGPKKWSSKRPAINTKSTANQGHFFLIDEHLMYKNTLFLNQKCYRIDFGFIFAI